MLLLLLAFLQWLSFVTSQAVVQTPVYSAANLTHEIVTFDQKAAIKAAVPLSRKLLGLSIEFCYITSYVGDLNQPNAFSYQLLKNIQDRTGYPPRIRIGGNTQDRAKYCENCPMTLNNTFVPGNTEAVNVSFNQNLFTVLNSNMPSNQEYIFGLNLGQNDVQIPLAEVKASQTYMNLSRLVAYELGNEPDFFYSLQGIRNSSYDVVAYAQQSVEFLLQITASVLGQSSQQNVKFPGYMYGSMAQMTSFSIGNLVKLGVQKAVTQIKIFNLHGYFGDVCTPADAAKVSLPILLNHFNTVSFVSQYRPAIAAAHSVGDRFFIGETNSAACHGLAGVSDTLGAALWMLDYSLAAASAGVESIHFHNGLNFSYSVWDPTTIGGAPPKAKGLYYGYLLVADLVSDLQKPKISPIYSLDAENLAHYAVYASTGQLQKMVILNSDYFNRTTARTYKTFDVSSIFGKSASVLRLTGATSVAQNGLTWAGQTVDGGGKLSGAKLVEKVVDGVVTIGSTEAVIIQRA